MSIDFGLLREHALLVTLLVLGVVAIKALVLAVFAGRMHVSPKQKFLFGILLSQGGEFAFVVFGVAGQEHLLPEPWDALLTLAVALSMAMTPLLLVIHDRLLVADDRSNREADTIDAEHAPVIIAGFGRFGQIIGRLLLAADFRPTLLDYDPDQIELTKKFGFRVFFGDATRLDLLHAAGAAEAKLLVVAIDDVEASLRLVDIVREHFPKLTIIARARNVTHYMELRKRGVMRIERETFEASLRAGRTALEVLGDEPYEAREAADQFRAANYATLEALLPVMADEASRMSVARASREQLEKQVSRERAARGANRMRWKQDSTDETDPSGSDESEPAPSASDDSV